MALWKYIKDRSVHRIVVPIHKHENHWILGVVDMEQKFISIYDSFEPTWKKNSGLKDRTKSEHWDYILVDRSSPLIAPTLFCC